MNRRMMVLAISVVSAAAMALPAVASAGAWHLEPAQNGAVAGGALSLTWAGGTVRCQKTSGTSVFDAGSTTTGTISLILHECTLNGGLHCQTAGDPTRTITALNLPFHLVLLEATPRKPGILITPNATSGKFVTYECGGIPVVVSGNGILGELSSPACGAKSKQLLFTFALTGAAQQWTQITTTGTVYGLTAKVGGAAAQPTTMTGEDTITFANESVVNCT